MFYLSIHDENGTRYDIGNIKIGFKGQTKDISTYSTFNGSFSSLSDSYFSLGEGLEYYKKIRSLLSLDFGNEILSGLNDVVFSPGAFDSAQNESVFGTSLLRSVGLSLIKGQFTRVINNQAPLTNFQFEYARPQEEKFAGINLAFQVKAESSPSTNIHAIIGRNGVGKTTLLNGMIEAITDNENSKGNFYNTESYQSTIINRDYFSRLVSISFSAFDPFNPPPEQHNPALGTCYYYVGLKDIKKINGESDLKSLSQLQKEFCNAVSSCFDQQSKKKRWLKAIKTLESDSNFSEMSLSTLANSLKETLKSDALKLIMRMSSGHAVVILTVTHLVALTEEKTLLLIDEPESHLHPPLLSAFVRSLSELLRDRNGVAIIATHSPVVLQEIPTSCAWKITRSRLAISTSRPEIQTFGENVGVLTREVFGLEVVKSGFHQLLEKSVSAGGTFDEVLAEYEGQLGFEAKAILQAMIIHRDRIGGGQ